MVHIRADEAFASIVKMRNIALTFNAALFVFLILFARIVSRILIKDVKERNAADKALRIASTAFDTHDAILITDAASNIIKVNHSFTRVTGYSEEEVLGKNPRFMNSGRHNKGFLPIYLRSCSTMVHGVVRFGTSVRTEKYIHGQ